MGVGLTELLIVLVVAAILFGTVFAFFRTSGRSVGGPQLSARVREFKTRGDHAAAVALVRAETGMTAAEAERFVNALD